MMSLIRKTPVKPSPATSLSFGQAHQIPTNRIGSPHTAPGYQEHLAGRFELAFLLLKQQQQFSSHRAILAVLLVLAGAFLLGLELWLSVSLLTAIATIQPISFLMIGVLLFVLLSIGFALLSLVSFSSQPAAAAPRAAVFFDPAMEPPDDTAFARQFFVATRMSMFYGLLHTLQSQIRAGRRQDLWLRFSILFFALAFLTLSILAVVVLL